MSHVSFGQMEANRGFNRGQRSAHLQAVSASGIRSSRVLEGQQKPLCAFECVCVCPGPISRTDVLQVFPL